MEEFLKVMISNTPPTEREIATLVFMDLETTGLPNLIGKKNVNITEISLVAVDRSHFQDESRNLRILNKLSICIQPRSVVSLGAMEVTGLCNDILETQQTFDDSIPKLLEVFFSRLREPICLLAHNGKGYDFPVLQAELKRLDYSFPENILCADTLEAFRTMGLVPPNNHTVNTEAENSGGEFTDEAIDRLLSEDIELFRHLEIPGELPVMKTKNCSINNEFETWDCCNTCTQNTDNFVESIFSILQNGHINPGYGEKTPMRSNTSVPQNGQYRGLRKMNETTPHSSGESTSTPSIYTKDNRVNAKRKLFEMTGNKSNMSLNTNMPISLLKGSPLKPSAVKQTLRKSYALDKLYTHYFGELPPGHHHAEYDTINLSKICQNVSMFFLPWLDKNNVPFCLIPPLW